MEFSKEIKKNGIKLLEQDFNEIWLKFDKNFNPSVSTKDLVDFFMGEIICSKINHFRKPELLIQELKKNLDK